MSNTKNKNFKKNNSNLKESSAGVKALRKIYQNGGGSVSYVFIEERLDKHSKPVQKKSVRFSNIDMSLFYKIDQGREIRKSFEEVLKILEDTKHDIGADHFILD